MSAKLWTWTGWRATSPYGWRIHPVYGDRRFHRGIDLAQPNLSPVDAFVGGKVLVAQEGEPGFGGYGVVVAVQDSHSHLHCYAHLHDVAVKPGDVVRAGNVLGRMGSTGISTGPHLHYEIRSRITGNWGWATDVDPEGYLRLWLTERPAPKIQQRIRVVFRERVLPLEGYLVEGTSCVPVRMLAEALGLTVDYHEGTVCIRRHPTDSAERR